jgi:hypothetical protein
VTPEKVLPTLHNDTSETVHIRGCPRYKDEKLVGGTWEDLSISCANEGNAIVVAGGETYEATGLGFTCSGDTATWRLCFEVGHGCQSDVPLSEAQCSSIEEVCSPTFDVN